MPPKKGRAKKQVDPEVLKRQFEEFEETEECKKWKDLAIFIKDYPSISETEKDVTGRWQKLHDQIFLFGKMLKVKSKLKEIRHDIIRSFFFAMDDPKFEYYIDGIYAGLTKETFGDSWSARKKYIEILKGIEDISNGEINETNFQVAKKKMCKDISELYKQIIPHTKKNFKEIYDEKLLKVIEPFSSLLKSNMLLSLFEMAYDNPYKREVAFFKHKILVDNFCKDLQRCQEILYDIEKDPEYRITHNPDVRRIFNKLTYGDWESNNIERFYLYPLKRSFLKMRVHMCKQFSQGIDFWKIPLSRNSDFLQDLREVIEAELIAENLLGDELKRDQLNFLFNIFQLFIETPSKDLMLQKKDSILLKAIPQLVVFKTLQHMRKIIDEKEIEDNKRELEREEKLQADRFIKSMLQIQRDQIEEKSQEKSEENVSIKQLSPRIQYGRAGSTTEFAFDKINLADIRTRPSKFISPEQAKKKLNEEEEEYQKLLDAEAKERKKYGRFWIWENYLPTSNKIILLEGTELLRDINEAVQQDIQDEIITKGLFPLKDKNAQREARKFVDKKIAEYNQKEELNNRRPPKLWNHPYITEEHHQYRANAAPLSCYIDMRIHQIQEIIDKLANEIQSFRTEFWTDLINRVIDVYIGNYNKKHTEFSPEEDQVQA